MFHDVKLTRGNAIEINYILDTTNFDHPMGNRFRYAVTKNVEATGKEIEEVKIAFPAPEGLVEYTNKRRDIYKKHSIKDEKAYKEMSVDAKKVLDGEVKQLETDNKALIDEVKALEEEKSKFLEEEITLKLYKLHIDSWPTISQNNKYPAWDIWDVLLKHVITEPDD